MLNSQRVAYASNNSSFNPAGNSSVNLPTEITAGANNDLFIYELKDIDIKKGQRIAVPIFEMMSSYKDVYTWDYHLRRHQSAGATTSSGSVIENTVWHRIELTNESKIPWTTGAALIMQGKQPLAQELLTYTSPGRKVRVGVTIAVSLQPEFKEKEVSREFKNLHFDRYDYCKITNFAELDICNNFNKDAEVEINLFFGGVADKISDKGAATLKPFANEDWEQYHGSPAVNNSTKLIWKAVIKPGESFKPTVQFHYFMRH
jgi:hypothetical protein